MKQKYRLLDVGELLEATDEVNLGGNWIRVGSACAGYVVNSSASPTICISGSCPVGYYRRPIMEQKYRMLEKGEVIQATDEVWEFGRGPWEPVSESEHGQKYRNGYNEMRRPIPADEVSELKQKLSVAEQQWMKWEQSWFDQRAKLAAAQNQIKDLTKERDDAVEVGLNRGFELAAARNQITDLTRHLEDAQSDNWQDIKVSKNDETHTLGTLIPLLETEIKDLTRRLEDAQSDNERLRKDLCNTTVMLMGANSKNYDARQIIPNLERKVAALQEDLEKSRGDVISVILSRVKLTEERNEAVAEVERLRLVEASRMLKKILSQG
jgi:hypothetical protein